MRKLWIAIAALAVTGALSAGGGALAATQAVPANTAPPTISGTTTVGHTLTADDGTWTNSPTSFTYQWLRCNGGGNKCKPITGATMKTYTLVAADAGKTLRVDVTATNASGSATARSAQTAAVAAATSSAAPKSTSPPTISGVAKAGQILTADPGSWSGNPTSFTYQWQRCDADVATCSAIVGATAKTYTATAGDVGYRLRVQVTAHNAKGATPALSAITTIVQPAVAVTNHRPTLRIISVIFLGQTVYARFRLCDDTPTNLAIVETDSRPGKLSYTRRFATLVPPRPCGVYTRHWIPVTRFRGPGRYSLTLRARDKSGLTSLPARRTFSHG